MHKLSADIYVTVVNIKGRISKISGSLKQARITPLFNEYKNSDKNSELDELHASVYIIVNQTFEWVHFGRWVKIM